jgi:O-antigen ligase
VLGSFHIPVIVSVLGFSVAFVVYVYVLVNDERWLIVSIMAYLLLFMHQAQLSNAVAPPLDIPEILFSIIFFPGLVFWFVRRFYKHELFIHDWGDIALFLFLAYGFCEIFVAVAQGFAFIKGVRELLLFVPLLLIFPVRKEAERKRGMVLVVWSFLSMSAIVGLFIIVRYRIDLSSANYFWQVASSRQQREEALYMCSIIILLAFLSGRQFRKSIMILFLAINVFALATTFSRGYWITSALGILLMGFFLKEEARKRMISLTGFAIVVAAVAAFIILPRLFGPFLTGLLERVSSISTNAISLRSRLAESQAVVRKISGSPVIGYGSGALFSFYDILSNTTLRTWYIHNAYLFLLFKFGVVGFLLFFAMYAKRFSALITFWRKTSSEFENALVSIGVVISLMMLFLSFTSPQFFDKGALMILAIVWGIGDSLRERSIET